MKRRKIIRYTLILLPVCLLFPYLFIKFSWLSLYSYKEMKYNAQLIDSASKPPENFLLVWDKLYPGSRSMTMNRQLLAEIFKSQSIDKDCKCDEIGYLAFDNRNHDFKFNIEKGVGKYRRFGYGLEYFSKPEKCFDFWINNSIYWDHHYLSSLEELSQITLKKDVKSLSQSEILQLIAYINLGFNLSKDKNVFDKYVLSLTKKLQDS